MSFPQPSLRAEAADLIVTGRIYTADDVNRSVRAFAVRGDRFIYAGSVDGALALRGSATRLLDLGDYAVLPGIVDAHLHLTNLGLKLDQVDLEGVASVEELIERTRSFADGNRDPWIFGRGWNEHRWGAAVPPSHHGLSEAIADRPVVLARVDGHAVLVNACAMKVAGIGVSSADPPGGRILRDASGNPTGVFIDAAEALVYEKAPKPSRERLMQATRAAIAQCNRWGITTVCEPGCDDDVLAAHADLIEDGQYTIRNYAMLHDEPSLIERRMRDGIPGAAHGGRLWVRAIKMYADGALGSRGAALLAPYADDPLNSGLIVTPPERIAAVTEAAVSGGFQVCVHAIGDRANRNALDAFEAALVRVGRSSDPRLRIEHAQVLAPEDIHRFAKLGVVASMQTSHALSDGPWVEARLGPERAAGAYAWRWLLDSGARIANGTDAPVEPPDTIRSFLAAVTHGEWHCEQRMTRSEALASMTIDAAYAAFAEKAIGSIAPGKYADFVVIDRDWTTASLDEIASTGIVATYFGGRCVYEAPFSATCP